MFCDRGKKRLHKFSKYTKKNQNFQKYNKQKRIQFTDVENYETI